MLYPLPFDGTGRGEGLRSLPHPSYLSFFRASSHFMPGRPDICYFSDGAKLRNVQSFFKLLNISINQHR